MWWELCKVWYVMGVPKNYVPYLTVECYTFKSDIWKESMELCRAHSNPMLHVCGWKILDVSYLSFFAL